jgi:hypothetical protein
MPSPDFVSLVESPNGKKKLFLPEQIHYHIANQSCEPFSRNYVTTGVVKTFVEQFQDTASCNDCQQLL